MSVCPPTVAVLITEELPEVAPGLACFHWESSSTPWIRSQRSCRDASHVIVPDQRVFEPVTSQLFFFCRNTLRARNSTSIAGVDPQD